MPAQNALNAALGLPVRNRARRYKYYRAYRPPGYLKGTRRNAWQSRAPYVPGSSRPHPIKPARVPGGRRWT